MMNLLDTLPWRKPVLPRAALQPAPGPDARPAALCAAADAGQPDQPLPPLRGCGWFDSSHELQQGLCVLEHASADALADTLPLGQWLHLHLGGWPGALHT